MVLFPNCFVTIEREMDNGTIIGYNDDGDPNATPPIEPTPILLDCGTDGFDDIPHCLSELVSGIVGDFQPGKSTETAKEYGNVTQSQFLLFLDLGVDIISEDKVKITKFRGSNNYDGYYQVIGDPDEYSTIQPHIEVTLMKERK